MVNTSRTRRPIGAVTVLLVGATLGWIAWEIGHRDPLAEAGAAVLVGSSVAATALAAVVAFGVSVDLRTLTGLVRVEVGPDGARFVAIEDGRPVVVAIPRDALVALRVGEVTVDGSTLFRGEVDVAAVEPGGAAYTICLAGRAARQAVDALLEIRPGLPVQRELVDRVGLTGRFAPDLSTGRAIVLASGTVIAAGSLVLALASLVALAGNG